MLSRKVIRNNWISRDKIDAKESVTEPLQKFKESLERTNESTQELFEKQLYTIASGGIAVTVAFIDKIIPITTSRLTVFLYFGWLALVLTILTNLISHRVSHSFHYKTIMEIQDESYDPNKAIRRNKIIGIWNNVTIALLIFGISLIMFFITYNLITMSKETKGSVTTIQQGDNGTKGLQSTVPVVTKPNK